MQIQKIVEYLKTDWRKKAVIAGGALILVSLAILVLSMTARRHEVAGGEDNANTASALPAPKVFKDLYAAPIDNHLDARPVSGVSKAVLVYEAPVEGDITRLLAVFERGSEIAEIGPVRSARPYFLDWVAELGPSLFLHFGGSPEALSRIASTPFLREVDEDGMGNAGDRYWRDTSRDMPHNAYTSTDDVEKMFAARTGESRTVSAWLMAPDPDIGVRGVGEAFTVPLSKSANYQPEWRYDRERNVYVRHIRGIQEFDRQKNPLEAKNVIVMETTVKVLDDIGRLRVATDGTGKATVYHNGEKIDATWRNDAGGAPVRFYGSDGLELALTNGSVWIEVVKK